MMKSGAGVFYYVLVGPKVSRASYYPSVTRIKRDAKANNLVYDALHVHKLNFIMSDIACAQAFHF